MVARLDRREEFFGGEYAPRADLGQLDARIGGRASGLVPDRVGLAADDHIVAGTRERAQRNLVRHRAAGQPQRRFLAEHRGDAFLQRVDRGVVAVLVVADGSRRRSPIASRAKGG